MGREVQNCFDFTLTSQHLLRPRQQVLLFHCDSQLKKPKHEVKRLSVFCRHSTTLLNYIVALTLLVYYFFQGWFPVLFVFVFLHLFMYEFNLINLHKFQSKSNVCVCVFIQRSDCMHVFSCKLMDLTVSLF